MKTNSIHLIQKNAARLVELNNEVKRAYKERMKSSEAELKWNNACQLFQSSYDILAFPGGLIEGMGLLKNGDLNAIENGINFLAADPYFFRSGYLKEKILHYLARLHLNKRQVTQLQEILLARIESNDRRREFKNYCSLAEKISDHFFIERIKKILETGNPVSRWKANAVLTKLGYV